MTDVKRDPSVETEKREYTHAEQSSQSDDFDPKNKLHLAEGNTNAKLSNPLVGIPHDKLEEQALAFAHSYGLSEHADIIRKGALVAQDPLGEFRLEPDLTPEEKAELQREQTHRWDQPKTLYYLVVLCSMAAAVQGMDETVINGANLFWPRQFGLFPDEPGRGRDQWLLGLVASAPYLCCAVLGCWLTDPMNRMFGRRGTIFITATLSWLTCFWQGVTNSWPHLFAARFVLGLGVGPKSSTVPVYAAECSPAPIRGALVMMWQMWTAFGIMLGFVADLMFYHVKDTPNITGLNWRLMLGSAGVPALAIMAQVYFCPESPRWLMGKGRYLKAFESLCRLRKTKIMAARDFYYIHTLLVAEQELKPSGKWRIVELFTIPRNRRAALASFIVMFMQQFCGINVIGPVPFTPSHSLAFWAPLLLRVPLGGTPLGTPLVGFSSSCSSPKLRHSRSKNLTKCSPSPLTPMLHTNFVKCPSGSNATFCARMLSVNLNFMNMKTLAQGLMRPLVQVMHKVSLTRLLGLVIWNDLLFSFVTMLLCAGFCTTLNVLSRLYPYYCFGN
ncbi:proton myo-inositol cotransporter [Rhizoctonia solani AG-1 IA]|uniref:Proton myo-inositol cotransporter n=1 Tax=Thanatephorus cucumeris (strain AG1-IA) TaxID=983506 RepID=L8X7R6_THACA|nr:proton myo-inositol cotransporter [Rhizoctonia solani AG-1 IA]